MEKTKKVFLFTFTQMIKKKTYMITFLIFLLVSILTIPVLVIVKGEDLGNTGISIVTNLDSIKNYIDDMNSDFDGKYAIQYAYSFVLLMMSIIGSSYIVRTVVEEKSSKLVETLLVSINSKNMILGKILAVMALTVLKVIVIGIGVYASYLITTLVVSKSAVYNAVSNVGISTIILNMGIINVIFMFISGIIAFFIFSMLAGLVAAGCNSVDEEESQVQSAMLVIMVSYFVSSFLSPISLPTVQYVGSLIPLVSAFMAPVNYMMGSIPWFILVASWIINLCIAVVVYKLSGNLYDSLILYRGKPLKLTKILTMNIREGGK